MTLPADRVEEGVRAEVGKLRSQSAPSWRRAWEVEKTLSRFHFRGIPFAHILSAVLDNEIGERGGDWSTRNRLKNRLRFRYHADVKPRLRSRAARGIRSTGGRILVTWISESFRHSGLVFPVVERLGADNCTVMYPDPAMLSHLPEGTPSIEAHLAAASFDIRAWRRDFDCAWRSLRPALVSTLAANALPPSVAERLADAAVTSTQLLAGFAGFLERSQVQAVLTDFDRYEVWAPLVLAARSAGIPTFTLTHGVFGDECWGFYPLLAETMFCWGALFKRKMERAGVDTTRLIVAGCPRLNRDLPLTQPAARSALRLDADGPVAVLASENFPHIEHRIELAETFCRAVSELPGVSGFVRLHPVDDLRLYSSLAEDYPDVRFTTCEQHTLDQVLAAADLVVVHSSGSGSDALVKRRMVVVLDAIDWPLLHGQDLIDGGCPRATSVESLRAVLQDLLLDSNGDERRRREASREEYIEDFCAYFGEESADRIAGHVLGRISDSRMPTSPQTLVAKA